MMAYVPIMGILEDMKTRGVVRLTMVDLRILGFCTSRPRLNESDPAPAHAVENRPLPVSHLR